MKKVLYVSWDGDAQDYMESLFLPLFGAASGPELGWRVCQFTWADQARTARAAKLAQELNIGYDHFGVLRKPQPVATAAMIAFGASVIERLIRMHKIDLVFARSTIPAAMSMLATWRHPKARFVYDADGFMADERVDFGAWRAQGPMYRLFRDLEAQAVRRAAAVMTRTERARQILIDRAGAGIDPDKIHVIPNGKDATRFAPAHIKESQAVRAQESVAQDAPWALYVGSLGPQYFPAELVRWFEALYARDARARFHVLTGQEEVMRAQLDPNNEAHQKITVKRVPPAQVPAYLAAADVGLSLRQSSFSQQGVCPIKIAEYLLCGTPVISTSGVGDMDEVLGDETGFVLNDLSPAQLDAAAGWVIDEVVPHRQAYSARCRAQGLARFDLERHGQSVKEMLLGC